MRALRGILHWIPRVLAGLAVLLAVLIGTGVLQARIVLSDSMKPHFYKNDLVVGAGWLKPNPGDIAIYQQRDTNGVIQQDVVHRVVTISQAGEYMFKGDNNQSPDALLVPKSDVKGVIVLKIPAIGGLFNPLGAVEVLAIIGGIWGISAGIVALRRGYNSGNEE